MNGIGVRAVIFRLASCYFEAKRLSISRPGADVIGWVAHTGWDRNLSMPSCPTAWRVNIANDLGLTDALGDIQTSP